MNRDTFCPWKRRGFDRAFSVASGSSQLSHGWKPSAAAGNGTPGQRRTAAQGTAQICACESAGVVFTGSGSSVGFRRVHLGRDGQHILQFKLETVCKLIPRTTTACPPTAVSGCCLMGTGCGCVEDCHGPFYGQAASIHAFIPSEHSKNRAIRYTVGSGQEGLSLYASGCGVEVPCPACGEAELLLRGTGQVKWFSPKCADRTEKAAYTLAVRRDRQGRLSFRMQFSDPHSQYDSGFIKVTGRPSDLRMGGC